MPEVRAVMRRRRRVLEVHQRSGEGGPTQASTEAIAMENALTPAQIRELVDRAAEEGRPLDHVLCEALFGSVQKRPRYEKDWPENARAAYHAAVVIFFNRIRTEPPKRKYRRVRRCERPPTLEDAWKAVLSFSLPDRPWCEVPGLSWWRLGQMLGVSARVAHYHMSDVMGWVFHGKQSLRRIDAAPCRGCEAPVRAALLEAGRCPHCR
jgi:hypothetical protein